MGVKKTSTIIRRISTADVAIAGVLAEGQPVPRLRYGCYIHWLFAHNKVRGKMQP